MNSEPSKNTWVIRFRDEDGRQCYKDDSGLVTVTLSQAQIYKNRNSAETFIHKNTRNPRYSSYPIKEIVTTEAALKDSSKIYTLNVSAFGVWINGRKVEVAFPMDADNEKDNSNKMALLGLANEMGYEASFLFQEMTDRLEEMLEEI